MNLNIFGRIEEALSDIEFFSGASPQMVLAELDRDMKDYEIMHTLEDLKERIIERLVSEGRTYEMPSNSIGHRHKRNTSSQEGYFG